MSQEHASPKRLSPREGPPFTGEQGYIGVAYQRNGEITSAGLGFVTIEFDRGTWAPLTIRTCSGRDWSPLVGHRVRVSEHGDGKWKTYRLRLATFGVRNDA